MSRNLMPAPTDDTRVDLRRPIFDSPSTPIPAAILPDLEPEEEDDAATIQLSRLAWPEPPIKLAERARIVRTDGGVSRTAAPVVVREMRPTYWRGLAVAMILAALISVFVPRPRSQPRAAVETTPQPRAIATAIAPQPAVTMPPPLIITVGTPPSAVTAAPPASKPPVPVTKLPVARAPVAAPRAKAPSAPAVRPKPASPSATRSAPASKPAASSAEAVVDDGF
jgi:hypothetical protein